MNQIPDSKVINTAELLRALVKDVPIEKRGLGEWEKKRLATIKRHPR